MVSEGEVSVTEQHWERWYKSQPCLQGKAAQLQVLCWLSGEKIGITLNPASSCLYRLDEKNNQHRVNRQLSAGPWELLLELCFRHHRW